MAASAMRRVSLRNLAAHKVRLVLTVLSVVLGTSFVAGSIIFTATISSAFDKIFDGVALGVDTRVSPKETQANGVPNSVLDTLNADRQRLGIAKLVPRYSAPVTIATADAAPCRVAARRASVPHSCRARSRCRPPTAVSSPVAGPRRHR